MNDKKFWKIIYLYITKYNYSILYYRPEKKDVWLINEDNELLRLIYSEDFKATEIDSIVSNVIRNEVRLKKMFRLNSLKIKILYISPKFDEIIADYKKYRISGNLSIERILYNEKNSKLFIQEKDIKFINNTPDTLRYKNRVVDLYKRQSVNKNFFDVKYNLLSVTYSILFIFNMLTLFLSEKTMSFYQYFEYNYQKIIGGQFYRLFMSAFAVNNIKNLLLIVATVFTMSILLNKAVNIWKSLVVIFIASFSLSLFLIFGYSGSLDVALVANFAVLGASFFEQLSSRNTNNLKFMYASALSIVYFILSIVFFNVSLTLYVFSFVLGVFVQLLLMKKRVFQIAGVSILVVCFVGVAISLSGINNTSGFINNYRAGQIEQRLLKGYTDEEIFNLERELTSKNKSVLTYYELGMLKMTTSSKQDAKKVFLEGINFDDSFAPIYYNLGLLERQEGNYAKGKEYAEKAYSLDKKEKYRNLIDELNNV